MSLMTGLHHGQQQDIICWLANASLDRRPVFSVHSKHPPKLSLSSVQCLQGVADRVLLGLLPSSRDGWRASLGALRPATGGLLHLHHNVKDSEEAAWIANTQVFVTA